MLREQLVFITKVARKERIRLDKVLRLFIFALFDSLLWVRGSDHMNKGSWSCFTGRVNVDLVGVQVLLVWQSCRKCHTCVRTVLCSMTWALASLCAIKCVPSSLIALVLYCKVYNHIGLNRWLADEKIWLYRINQKMKKYDFTELIKTTSC